MAFKNEKVRRFILNEKGELTGIRSVLLFGKNTMSYKFALCDALLKLNPKNSVSYDDILPFFNSSFLEHVKRYPKQGIMNGKYLKAANGLIKGEVQRAEFDKIAQQTVHKNVFEAFQKVGGSELSKDYSLFEWDKKTKMLTLKDNFVAFAENESLNRMLQEENQSRWEIVESAWRLEVNPGMITYDEETKSLVKRSKGLRIGLRSAVDALMPYQKGLCFYCNKNLNRFGNKEDNDFPEVDHLLPFARLRDIGFTEGNINGLWNLVLACRECNRDKGAKIPKKEYFIKLKDRNEYLVEEHGHLFKIGILLSLNLSPDQSTLLAKKMASIYNQFQALGTWKPSYIE